MTSLRLAAAGAVLALVGCNGHEHEAVTICEDYADVVATAFADCDIGTYEDNLQAFEDALPGGDCDGARGIRDLGELTDVCYPFFRESSCDTLNDPDFRSMIPDECRNQIIFPE